MLLTEKSMKRAIVLTGCLTILAALLAGASLTGTWKGQFDFGGTPVPLSFEFKANGDVLTGTVTGLPSGAGEIKDGKIQGATLTFLVMTEYQGAPIKLVYKCQLSGEELRINMGTEDGSWGVDFVAKRAQA
jgi:hypothetical protein